MTEPNPLLSLLAGLKPKSSSEAVGDSVRAAAEEAATATAADDSMAMESNTIKSVLGILDPTVRAEQQEIAEAGMSIHSLANLNTDSIIAIKSRADRVVAESEKFILRDAESFRAVADALDEAMQSDDRFNLFGLAPARNYVMSLMTTLSRNEEMSTILLDRDVRNCILFARKTYEANIEHETLTTQVKASRAASRASTPSGKAKSAKSQMIANALKGINLDDLGF